MYAFVMLAMFTAYITNYSKFIVQQICFDRRMYTESIITGLDSGHRQIVKFKWVYTFRPFTIRKLAGVRRVILLLQYLGQCSTQTGPFLCRSKGQMSSNSGIRVCARTAWLRLDCAGSEKRTASDLLTCVEKVIVSLSRFLAMHAVQRLDLTWVGLHTESSSKSSSEWTQLGTLSGAVTLLWTSSHLGWRGNPFSNSEWTEIATQRWLKLTSISVMFTLCAAGQWVTVYRSILSGVSC